MKKIFLIAVLAIMSLGASAQVEQGMRFGIQGFGGLNSINDDGTTFGASYGGGVVFEYNLDQNMYVGSGLNFQNKGFKFDTEVLGVKIDDAVNNFYITLPIHFGYRVYVSDNTSIHFQGGPQLAYSVGGSKIWDLLEHSDWCKPFEVAVGIKVGAEFNKFQVNLGANYGLTKTCKGSETVKDYGNNLDFTVGVAYMFK